nr:alpha/beta hydrolase [Novosphingobium sp. 9]
MTAAGGSPGASADWREAISRRAALARERRPSSARAPSLKLLWSELGSLLRLERSSAGHLAGGKPVRSTHVAGGARPQLVMLLPGFGAHPKRMRRLRLGLEAAGHEVHDWGLGVNFGPNPANFAFLMRRVGTLARARRQPVTLIGWSLGGLFAREIARREPEAVSRVITMGTPFSGDPRNNNAWRAYQVITGHSVDAPPVDCDFATKPPVPTIALWSPRDGVIHPRSACGWPGERDLAVAVRCTHLGFSGDPRVVAEVLRQLQAAI